MGSELVPPDSWAHLRRHTAARIAIGRSGGSLPTRETLDLAYAQALARDAVWAPFDAGSLSRSMGIVAEGIRVLESAAGDRAAYLARPDLGRSLSPESLSELHAVAGTAAGRDVVVIVSDGLSALAAERQAPPLVAALLPRLRSLGFTLAPLLVVRHARVGIIDPVGHALKASIALILLGERPGLGSPDSLGAYFTFGPGPGRTDADRNCVSNIRPGGLGPSVAAERLAALLVRSSELRLSGARLKESDDGPGLPGGGSPLPG
jgi:ethanolamine ammonia-lyase small subunit